MGVTYKQERRYHFKIEFAGSNPALGARLRNQLDKAEKCAMIESVVSAR